MVFSSLIFIYLFLPVFFISYFIFKSRKWRNIILLLFSLVFYAYGEPIYSLLMIFSIVVNYFMGILISKKESKCLFIFTVIFNLGLLGLFKYFNFFIDNVNNIFNLNINFIKITLPIGISFYTFQILTYIIDVYKKRVEVQKSNINLGCYICAFPQLIAGPIVRYSTVNEELENRKESLHLFSTGLRRFILGLSKKVIIANGLAYICDSVLALGANTYGFIGSIIILISYSLQIYFDFSGYSDMAIGLGKMLGFNYLENFNYPYIATSVTDFWRRWHISLSSFFKDYVYIPLGGNRVKKILNIRNLLIVWMLTGLWHGASWNFILWGLYYGVLLILEKYVIKNIINKFPNWLKHVYTLIIVGIGWLLFLSTDLNVFASLMKSLVGLNGLGNISLISYTQIFSIRYILAFILGVIFSLPIINKINLKFGKKSYIKDVVLVIIFILSTILLLVDSYNPFIYFRF